ncbi:MAG: hypothetical protein M3511_16235 [Deinococcota bacterium]|nr:hypothetical protein [Deinococcota bacterium]
MVGARLEWSRLKSNPATWLFGGVLVLGGLALGGFGQIAGWQNDILGALVLSLFLTIISAFWGWQATAAAIRPQAREIVAARSTDEWTLHLVRLCITGLYGGLVTMLFFLAATTPRFYLLEPWWVALNWLPHVVLAHVLAASLGGLAALLFARLPGLGIPATFALWLGWWYLALSLGPLWPDLTLRVLRWSNVLRDAAAESLYWPLLASFAAAILILLAFGMMTFSLTERRHLTVVPLQGRHLAWSLATTVVIAALLATAFPRYERETRLLAQGVPTNPKVDTVLWRPSDLSLTLQSSNKKEMLQGPARPNAVSNLDFTGFAPYLGRHGVVLPVSRVTGPGPYNFVIDYPSSWLLYGCSEVTLTQTGAAECRGEAAERDWFILLPRGVTATELELAETLNPFYYRARLLIRATVEAALETVNPDSPEVEVLPFGGPFWLSERSLSQSTIFGDPQLVLRNAASHAALAIAMHLASVRQPNLALWGVEDQRPEPNLPLALVAAADRLVFELGQFELDPTEAARRRGGDYDRS